MYFDGSSSKEGARDGIVLVSPVGENIWLMYTLEFHTTNNTTEYEALVLGLRVAKGLGIKQINVFGDFELVIQQVVAAATVLPKFLKFWAPPHDLALFLIIGSFEPFDHALNFE